MHLELCRLPGIPNISAQGEETSFPVKEYNFDYLKVTVGQSNKSHV